MSLSLPPINRSKQHWGQLYGCSLTLALAEYCQATPGIKLLVAPDSLTATQWSNELPFFLNTQGAPVEILFFPDWETLPYDQFSPHQDIISERLYTLSRLQQSSNAIVITACATLMHRLCPIEFLNRYGLVLKDKQTLNIHQFKEQLIQSGYHCVSNVLEHGEFAVRGAIIDLYPMGSDFPFRIELFDNEVDSLRRFDPETSRTVEKISEIHILPAREYPMDEQGIANFRKSFRDLVSVNPSLCPIYESVSNAKPFAGLEYYLALFFDSLHSIFDYLPKTANIALIDSLPNHAEHFWQEIGKRYEQRRYDVSRPLLPPEQCFLNPTELLTNINLYPQLRVSHQPSQKKGAFNFNTQPPLNFPIDRQAAQPLHRLCDNLTKQTQRTLLVVESAGRREIMLDLLKQSHITPAVQTSWHDFLTDTSPINIIVATLGEGVQLNDENISVITEAQIFGEQSTPQRRNHQKSIDPDVIIRDLSELKIGAPVVHLQFGVGRYLGLQAFHHNETLNEFLVLSYADQDKIYVPITSLHLISKYTGADSEHAPLHRLGSDQWQKEKKKAAEKIHDVAIELLDVYAKREARQRPAYELEQQDYQRFASGFPFEETQDQSTAIHQIIQDMQSNRPMDRLICGDVGFGKTEVAMRAAFIAVQNGRQVCVLAPTTLLAGQHFESFRDRFADFPIQIELLSRFRSEKESVHVLNTLTTGRTDIVIGTHKLFQKNVKFQQLGLLIIDEEHRFGVKQKEYIKSLRTDVDILSMTATPIPRTLNMAMAGIRDISLITTPPAKRLSIKTFWQERNSATLREAILREILRGGQVFFLHNKVQTIEHVCQEIQALVPEAKIQSAHGQMKERELERIMTDFYHHRFHVLVCTTIIETGIDIPTANTIVIDRADQFGLAQLHQLRGRVGRSHHQAYAYLLTPNEKALTPDALKRLKAVVELEELGSGFSLATHDMEIRGAGELLGEDQSGNMQAIGFHLFMELLDKAVSDLKSGKTPELSAPIHQGPEMDFNISAIIPEDYINDVHLRLMMYKRISNATDKKQLHDLQVELIDRFGLLPPSVKHLLLITQLKFQAIKLGIERLRVNQQQGKIEFNDNPQLNTSALITLIQQHSDRYQLNGPTQLKFTLLSTQPEERIHEVSALLDQLS